MSREEIISAIRSRNPSAHEAFLVTFATPLLTEYLGHLTAMQDRDGAGARWVRATRDRACVRMKAD